MNSVQDDRVLVLKNISKSFPGVKVLDGIDMEIRKGEVHALLGENGAGKSTLMKILAGIHSPDQGKIIFQGENIILHHPNDAKNKGIILIHQEISLIPELSVAENIFLGSVPVKSFRRVDWKKLRSQAREILDELHCPFSENELAGNLSIAHRQMVEIAKALAYKPKLVLFDEPTSSLTDQDKKVLFDVIGKLKSRGVAIYYISHRMDEIFEISDRITILRDGVKTGTLKTSETNAAEVTKLMIGRELLVDFEYKAGQPGDEVLRVEKLSKQGLFQDITFSIRKGEVLGLYGLVGAGRTEIAETIFGMRRPDRGKIYVHGKPETIRNSKAAVRLGIGYVPEDRKNQGLVLNLSCQSNLSLARINRMHKAGFIQRRAERELFQSYKDKLAIKTPSGETPVVHLSGGNQQKVIIGKWLSMNPKLLILDEPTKGVDVGAKSEIHQLIRKMAEEGYAILVISSEMPEIMGVSDRILTIYQGAQTAQFHRDEFSEDNLILGATNQIEQTAG